MRPNEVTGSFLDVIGVYVCERLVIWLAPEFGSHSKGAGPGPSQGYLLTACIMLRNHSAGKPIMVGMCTKNRISSSSLFSIPNAWLDKLFSLIGALSINSDDGVAARFITQRGCVQC